MTAWRWGSAGLGGRDELRHGYTLADLERIAAAVTATTRAYASDYDDRYAEAYGAIAIHLYEAEHPPPEHQLFRAGQDALWEANRLQRSYRGCPYDPNTYQWGEAGTGPRFVRYWSELNRPAPSPESLVVDRVALQQILPTLSPTQRRVVDALAAFGDHAAARSALGLNGTFCTHLASARKRFLRWWHEHEEPSRPWAVAGGRRRAADAASTDRQKWSTLMRQRRQRAAS